MFVPGSGGREGIHGAVKGNQPRWLHGGALVGSHRDLLTHTDAMLHSAGFALFFKILGSCCARAFGGERAAPQD